MKRIEIKKVANKRDELLEKYRLSPVSIQLFRSKIKNVSKEDSLELGKILFDTICDKNYDENKDLNKVISLILAGANTNYYDKENDSLPLLLCARRNYLWTGIMLIRGGANINCKNNLSYSPIMKAATYGNDLVLEILILLGANINEVNRCGKTALMMAKASGQQKCFDMLVKAGAKMDIESMQVSKDKDDSIVTYEHTIDLIKEAELRLEQIIGSSENTFVRKRSSFKRIK